MEQNKEYKKYTLTSGQVEALFILLNAINLEHLKRGDIVLNERKIDYVHGTIIKAMFYDEKFAEQK